MKASFLFNVNDNPQLNCECIQLGAVLKFGITLKDYNDGGNDVTVVFDLVNTTTGSSYSYTGTILAGTTQPASVLVPDFTTTEAGNYTATYTVTVDGEDVIYQKTFDVCLPIGVDITSCGNYVFNNNFEVDGLLSVRLPDGTFIIQEVAVAAGGTYDVILPDPGLYIFEFIIEVGGDPVTYNFTFKNVCSIEACFTSLITQVLCVSDKDPCCTLCNEAEKEKVQMLRHELNKLLGLYLYWQGITENNTLKYIGVLQYSEEQLAVLQKEDAVIKKIVEISKRCGIQKCQEDVLASIDCGC